MLSALWCFSCEYLLLVSMLCFTCFQFVGLVFFSFLLSFFSGFWILCIPCDFKWRDIYDSCRLDACCCCCISSIWIKFSERRLFEGWTLSWRFTMCSFKFFYAFWHQQRWAYIFPRVSAIWLLYNIQEASHFYVTSLIVTVSYKANSTP